jgi:hypothetical protein
MSGGTAASSGARPTSAPRALLFCTSYTGGAASPSRWRRWCDYYDARRDAFGVERLCLIDDGSPVGAACPGTTIVDCERLPDELPAGIVCFRFAHHYGRRSLHSFAGWWRSFAFAAHVARRYGFDKLLHVESDAFVLTRRLADRLRALDSGWSALWCPRFRMPESAVQVLCGPALIELEGLFAAGPPAWEQSDWRLRWRAQARRLRRRWPGTNILMAPMALLGPQTAEYVLPFDRVLREFRGDRYGEFLDEYPPAADYVCQARPAWRFDEHLRP